MNWASKDGIWTCKEETTYGVVMYRIFPLPDSTEDDCVLGVSVDDDIYEEQEYSCVGDAMLAASRDLEMRAEVEELILEDETAMLDYDLQDLEEVSPGCWTYELYGRMYYIALSEDAQGNMGYIVRVRDGREYLVLSDNVPTLLDSMLLVEHDIAVYEGRTEEL